MADNTVQKTQSTNQQKLPTPEVSSKTDPNLVSSEGEDLSNGKDSVPPTLDLSQFTLLLTSMKYIKRPQAVVPTNVPKNGFDQIQYYESGSTRRLYLYISGVWRYVTLT